MNERQTYNKKPYSTISDDSELNNAAIEYLTNWRKEHPETTFDIKGIHEKSTLFRNALKNGDYEKCAEIDEKELTKELKTEYIHLAVRRGYIDV